MRHQMRGSLLAACWFVAGLCPFLCAVERNAAFMPAKTLTLSDALARVFESNPDIKAAELEVRAVSAGITQAGMRPNPEISAEIQNLPALSLHDPFRSTETEWRITQKLETGGKRALRVDAAGREKDIAARTLERMRAEWTGITRKVFAEVVANQQRLENSRDLSRIAQRSHSIVTDRVAAGKASPVEQTRSLISLAAIQLEEEKQEKELAASKNRLAALWGGTSSDFEQAYARFEIPPSPIVSHECLEDGSEMKLADAAIEYRRSRLALEKAQQWPDVSVSAGYRRSNLDSLNTWVAGISIPLPLFDKRSGAVAEAQIRLEKAALEKRAAERSLRSGLAQAQHNYDVAVRESSALANTALPAAAEVLAATEEGYRLGKFDYLNVLDAQRTYAELKRKYIDAVAAGMMTVAEMQRFTGDKCRNISKGDVSDDK